MKSSIPGPCLLFLLLLLLSGGVSGLGSVLTKRYSYSYSYVNWKDAQSDCRRYHTDLATIHTQADVERIHANHYSAFVGLERVANYSSFYWRWTNGNYFPYYSSKWANSQPQWNTDCAVLSTDKKLYGTWCTNIYFFICQKRKGGGRYDFTPIAEAKTWSEAREYCLIDFDGLAVLEYTYDLSFIEDLDFPVWIGLHRDGETWKWSTGMSEYIPWASEEPKEGDCVAMLSQSKELVTKTCSTPLPFVCFKDNLVLVQENKTWEEALDHCRSLRSSSYPYPYHELVSVQPGQEHNQVILKIALATSEKVWTGLRFLAGQWLWVNGAVMLYTDLPYCPLETQRCGVVSKNDTGSIETADCTMKLNFLCYYKL